MADIRDVVGNYLKRMGIESEECESTRHAACWFLRKGSAEMMIAAHESESMRILSFFAPIMPVPEKRRLELFEKLLLLNYELPHGAFAIDPDDNYVILVATLQADHLDFDEFFANVESVLFAADEYDDELIEEFGWEAPTDDEPS